MTLRFSDAYNEGYDAYENGLDFRNPYPEEGSDQYEDWERGWGDAWEYWNEYPS